MNQLQMSAAAVKQENIPSFLDKDEFTAFVKRLCGDVYAEAIAVEQMPAENGMDAYEISNCDKGILIRATSGSAAAVAFNVYLKERCGYYIGMLTESGILPDNPPKVEDTIKNESVFCYRYFLNYCTFGYSFAFYDWEDFEKLIDRILLSGYNLVLNPIGQECVWRALLLEFGYTEEEVSRFLVGPNFMPWLLMMNMTDYLGHYPGWWWEDRLALARRFVERLEKFGVGCMLPGYSGMVPNDFHQHFPKAVLKDQGDWCGFDRPKYLLYSDEMFAPLARRYYALQNELIGRGKVHYYSSDPFHEGGITEGIDLTSFARTAYKLMQESDEKAVWVFQGWGENPRREMLYAIPAERTLITNLLADTNGNAGDSYGGRPWLYCTVNNFGGQHLLRGSLRKTLENPFSFLGGEETAVGIGLMPEAVENSEIFFDIMAENAVRKEKIATEEFLSKYILLRYGKTSVALTSAWVTLTDRIYIRDDICSSFESPFVACPSLEVDRVANCGNHAKDAYPHDLLDIAKKMALEYDSCHNRRSFLFDFIDTVRQLTANYAWHFVYGMQAAFRNRDKEKFTAHSTTFLTLLSLQKDLLLSSDMFLYANIEKKVRNLGKTTEEKDYFDFLMKTLITVWGDERTVGRPDANHRLEGILDGYAAREYGDLLRDFNEPRWRFYIGLLSSALENNTAFEEYPFDAYNRAFCRQKVGSTKPTGSTISTAAKIIDFIEKHPYS